MLLIVKNINSQTVIAANNEPYVTYCVVYTSFVSTVFMPYRTSQNWSPSPLLIALAITLSVERFIQTKPLTLTDVSCDL